MLLVDTAALALLRGGVFSLRAETHIDHSSLCTEWVRFHHL
jgi:hypothetical protein